MRVRHHADGGVTLTLSKAEKEAASRELAVTDTLRRGVLETIETVLKVTPIDTVKPTVEA